MCSLSIHTAPFYNTLSLLVSSYSMNSVPKKLVLRRKFWARCLGGGRKRVGEGRGMKEEGERGVGVGWGVEGEGGRKEGMGREGQEKRGRERKL